MTTPNDSALRRRSLFAGAGAVGALAAAAAVLPRVQPTPQPLADATPAAPDQAGYQLTEHVKQYYATARL